MQSGPITIGKPGSVCATELSWKLDWRPSRMRSTSPRRTAPGHTLAPSSSTTSPMIVASGCTKTPAPKTGTLSANGGDRHAGSIAEGGRDEVRARGDEDQGPGRGDRLLRGAGHEGESAARELDEGQGDAGVHRAAGGQLRHRARLQLGQGRRATTAASASATSPSTWRTSTRVLPGGRRRRRRRVSASRTCSRATARASPSSATRTATGSS